MTTSTINITGVDFVTVPTQDYDKAAEFYGEVLGLPFVKRWGEMPGGEFQAGNLTIAVMQSDAFGQEFAPHGAPIAFQVEDVAGGPCRARVQAASSFISDLIDSGFCHQAIFKDPDGNTLDIHHRYA